MPVSKAPPGAEVPAALLAPHQPMSVAGYTAQPQWSVDLVNRNKELEERVLRAIDYHASLGNEVDQRAVSLARTQLQTAFMWLNRSVFQPVRIDLPGESHP